MKYLYGTLIALIATCGATQRIEAMHLLKSPLIQRSFGLRSALQQQSNESGNNLAAMRKRIKATAEQEKRIKQEKELNGQKAVLCTVASASVLYLILTVIDGERKWNAQEKSFQETMNFLYGSRKNKTGEVQKSEPKRIILRRPWD